MIHPRGNRIHGAPTRYQKVARIRTGVSCLYTIKAFGMADMLASVSTRP